MTSSSASFLPSTPTDRIVNTYGSQAHAPLALSAEELNAILAGAYADRTQIEVTRERMAGAETSTARASADNIVYLAEYGRKLGFRRVRNLLHERLAIPLVWPEGTGTAHRREDVDLACNLVTLLEREHMPIPAPTSDFDGTIGIYLDRDGIYAEVSVGRGTIAYLVAFEGCEIEGEEPFGGDALPAQFEDVVKQYIAKRRASY